MLNHEVYGTPSFMTSAANEFLDTVTYLQRRDPGSQTRTAPSIGVSMEGAVHFGIPRGW